MSSVVARVTKLKNERRDIADACVLTSVVLAGGAALSELAVVGRFGWFFELFFAMCDPFVSVCTRKRVLGTENVQR